jgi:hypothetical protein
VAYRGEAGDALEAPTAEGTARLVVGANQIELAVASRSLHVADQFATVVERKRRKVQRISHKLDGMLVIARDVPHEDLGVWIAFDGGMRRIFGLAPVSLLERDGLTALRRLDRMAQRLRAELAPLAGSIRRAVEIGRGLDKVLVLDDGDQFTVFARRLFRDRAQLVLTIHGDGRIAVPDRKASREVVVTSRFGVTVRGDYLRFADRHGTDLARVAIPWIGPEDRDELARRIGQLVDRSAP